MIACPIVWKRKEKTLIILERKSAFISNNKKIVFTFDKKNKERKGKTTKRISEGSCSIRTEMKKNDLRE